MDSPASIRDTWAAVDAYLHEHLFEPDPILDAALAASKRAGLPALAISPTEGRLLELLARFRGARRILELGTLGGYSTIWLARALPEDGHILSLEREPGYAQVARENVANAGFRDRVEVRVGPALETLRELHAERAAPFDLIFLDADKRSNPAYLEWSLKLSGSGTAIVADNVVRAGAILDPGAEDPDLGEGGIEGLRCFYEMLGAEPRVTATAIQTVGAKGYDGFAVALVD